MSSKPHSSLNQIQQRIKKYILWAQVVAIPASALAVIFDQLGLQDIGVFGLNMKSKMQFIFLGSLVTIFPFAAFSVLYSAFQKRKLDNTYQKEDKYEREIRHDFVTSNALYLLMFIITWMPYSIISYAGYYEPNNCACLEESATLDVLKVISLNLLCISAFLSSLIRITRPFILKDIKARCRKKKQVMHAGEGVFNSVRESLLESSDSESRERLESIKS